MDENANNCAAYFFAQAIVMAAHRAWSVLRHCVLELLFARGHVERVNHFV